MDWKIAHNIFNNPDCVLDSNLMGFFERKVRTLNASIYILYTAFTVTFSSNELTVTIVVIVSVHCDSGETDKIAIECHQKRQWMGKFINCYRKQANPNEIISRSIPSIHYCRTKSILKICYRSSGVNRVTLPLINSSTEPINWICRRITTIQQPKCLIVMQWRARKAQKIYSNRWDIKTQLIWRKQFTVSWCEQWNQLRTECHRFPIISDILRKIRDPEKPSTLEDLHVVYEDGIFIQAPTSDNVQVVKRVSQLTFQSVCWRKFYFRFVLNSIRRCRIALWRHSLDFAFA